MGDATDLDQPIISIVMPVYNGERFLAEAIESILRQTEPRFELLVVDDGSTDRSADIAERFAAKDPRVLVVRLPHAGLVPALNEGISRSNGEFIARMDSDDIAVQTRFERQIWHLHSHPESAAVGGATIELFPDGSTGHVTHWPAHQEYRVTGEREDVGMPHPGAMIRAAALRGLEGYRAAFLGAEDADLWRRLIEIGHIDNLPEPVLLYRLHPDQVSNRQSAEQGLAAGVAYAMFVARADGGEPVWDSNLPLSPASAASLAGLCRPRPAAAIHAALAQYYCRRGQMEEFEEQFRVMMTRDPSFIRAQTTFDMFWKMIPALLKSGNWKTPAKLIAANPHGVGIRTKRRLGLWMKYPVSPAITRAWARWRSRGSSAGSV